MTKRVLITGGFGFIGGRLAEHLSRSGYQVVIGSRKVFAPPVWLPSVEVVQTKWADEMALKRICRGIDTVVHTAGMNAQNCSADPVTALAFNGLATARLVEAASRAGVESFVYLSTAHVYAAPLVGYITEETCPRNIHPYATTHIAGENVVLAAEESGRIRGIVLRIANVFGKPTHKDVNCWALLVNDLCRQAVQTGHLKLRSDGRSERNFIAMTELLRAIETLVFESPNADRQSGLFNVGAGRSKSVLTMAKLIQKRCETVLGIEPKLIQVTDSKRCASMSLDYMKLRLDKSGFTLDSRGETTEIDNLLLYCKAELGSL